MKSNRQSGKSYKNFLLLHGELLSGKKCAVATKNPDNYVKNFEMITKTKIKLIPYNGVIYHAVLAEK